VTPTTPGDYVFTDSKTGEAFTVLVCHPVVNDGNGMNCFFRRNNNLLTRWLHNMPAGHWRPAEPTPHVPPPSPSGRM
jgi:hypothetical protein